MLSEGLRAAFYLGVVLILIWALARGARRWPAWRQTVAPQDNLAMGGQLALDARRRLHLVRAGDHHALVLVGGPTDVMVVLPWREAGA